MKYVIVNGLKVYPFIVLYPGLPTMPQFCMFCEDICLRLDLQDGTSDRIFHSGVGEVKSTDERTEVLLRPYLTYEFMEAIVEICKANRNEPIAAMLGRYLVLNFSESEEDYGLAAEWAGAMDKMISALSKGSKRFCMDEAYVPTEGIIAQEYPQIENHANSIAQIVHKPCGIYDTKNEKFINITDVIEPYCQESQLIENPDNHVQMKNFGSISYPFSISYTEKGAYLNGNYQGEEKTVKLPDYYLGDKNRRLEAMDEYVFYHSAAEEVIFPEGLKHIDFLEADRLKKFNVPNGCESIKLTGCSSIEEVDVLPLSLKKIEILSCDSLMSLVVPESVEKIKLGNGCTLIRKIIINSSNLKECDIDISDGMIETIEFHGRDITIQHLNFDRCNSLKHISFGSADVKVEDLSIDSDSLSSLDLSNVLDVSKVKSVNTGIRISGSNITEIRLPENSESIPRIYRSKIKELYIPKSVRNIELGKLVGCKSLEKIHISMENEPVFSDDIDFANGQVTIVTEVISEKVRQWIDKTNDWFNYELEDGTKIKTITQEKIEENKNNINKNERVEDMEMQLSAEEIQMIMDNMGPQALQPEVAAETVSEPVAKETSVMPEMPAVEEAMPMPEEPAVEEVAQILEMPTVEEAMPMPEEPVVEEVAQILEMPTVEEATPMPEVPAVEEVVEPIPEPVVEEVAEPIPEPVVEAVEPMPEIPVAEEVAEPMPEMPAVEEIPMAEIPAVEEVLPELEIPVVEEETTIAEIPEVEEVQIIEPETSEIITEAENEVYESGKEEAASYESIPANLKFMNTESGKGAFCVEIDGTLLGTEAGTKHPVMITGNCIVYVNGNNLVTENICTGEKRDDKMEEMILYTITRGMKENIEENCTYANNSLIFKWLISKLLCIRVEERAIPEINDYFDFIQIGIAVACEGGNISFKTSEGNELFLVNLFERISTIRA